MLFFAVAGILERLSKKRCRSWLMSHVSATRVPSAVGSSS